MIAEMCNDFIAHEVTPILDRIDAMEPGLMQGLLDKAGEFFLKFFYQKINQSPIIIKEIDEDTYKALQNNPLYQTTFIGTYNNKTQTPEIAETQMPGINAFLNL